MGECSRSKVTTWLKPRVGMCPACPRNIKETARGKAGKVKSWKLLVGQILQGPMCCCEAVMFFLCETELLEDFAREATSSGLGFPGSLGCCMEIRVWGGKGGSREES